MDRDSTNPYVFDSPIMAGELFFGRDDIFRSIKEALIDQEQDNFIILYGQRRIGKTSVLHQIDHRLSEQYISVLIDLQSVPSDSPEGFLWEVASAIQQALQRDRDIKVELPSRDQFLADPQHAFGHDFLTGIEEVLGDRYLILMFDEAQLIREKAQPGPWEGDAFEYFLNLTHQYARLGFILSIESQEPPPLSTAGIQKKVGFLNRDEAVQLVVQPVQGLLTYDPEAVERILSFTSGHPYYVQLLCHSLFAYCQRVNTSAVTLTDVEAVLPEVVERAGADFQLLWDNSTPEEKFVLAALAQAGGERGQAIAKEELLTTLRRRKAPISAHQVAKAMVNLSSREIISFQAPYSFNVDVFRLWLRDQKRIGWVKRELAGTVEQWKRERVKIPIGRRKLLWGIGLAALLMGVLISAGHLREFVGQLETRVVERMRTTETALAATPTLTTPADTPTSRPMDTPTPVPTATSATMPTLSPTASLTPVDTLTPAAVSGLPERGDVLDVAIAPSDGQWVYATIKGKGIYRSTDGGLSWTMVAINGSGQDILIDPANPRRVFIAVWAGVLQSTDGGGTWNMIRRGLPQDQQVAALAWDPGDKRVIYAGLRASPVTGSAVYRSTDGGETWERLWGPAGGEALGNDVEALAIDPTSGTRYV
ncbi:MAG: AAA family ATPase, partial [Anaerolineae bacterium]